MNNKQKDFQAGSIFRLDLWQPLVLPNAMLFVELAAGVELSHEQESQSETVSNLYDQESPSSVAGVDSLQHTRTLLARLNSMEVWQSAAHISSVRHVGCDCICLGGNGQQQAWKMTKIMKTVIV